MADIQIRGIDISSYSLDDNKSPNSGAIKVCVKDGERESEFRLILKQEQIDELVAAADPIVKAMIREIASYRFVAA